jgi:hypothetical protein
MGTREWGGNSFVRCAGLKSGIHPQILPLSADSTGFSSAKISGYVGPGPVVWHRHDSAFNPSPWVEERNERSTFAVTKWQRRLNKLDQIAGNRYLWPDKLNLYFHGKGWLAMDWCKAGQTP